MSTARSRMNPLSQSSHSRRKTPEGDPLPKPEADPLPTAAADSNATSGENRPNASPEVIEGQHGEPPDPQLDEPYAFYRVVFTKHSAIPLGYIIAGNCVCSGCICLCIWGFSTIKNLDEWQKRPFNAMSLLLSGSLGFGIGYLFDQIGSLARGTLLQSKSHSVNEVCTSVRVINRGLNFES